LFASPGELDTPPWLHAKCFASNALKTITAATLIPPRIELITHLQNIGRRGIHSQNPLHRFDGKAGPQSNFSFYSHS
jgi:hypothetical protein